MRTLALILALLLSPAMAQEVDPYVDGDYQAHFLSTRADGGMTVTVGVAKRFISTLPPEATREQYIEIVRQSSDACRDDADCQLMPDDWVPPFDRRLRNAWKKIAKDKTANFKDVDKEVRGIDIDMPKARKIWEEKIQQAAVDELRRETMDVRIAEVRGDTDEIERLKTRRDALYGVLERLNFEAAKTPEELMAIWPAEISADLKPKEPTVEEKTKALQERRRAAEKAAGEPK